MNSRCRVPQGTRGLKWVEQPHALHELRCRVPQGTRGLKYRIEAAEIFAAAGRVPQGTRGLKFCQNIARNGGAEVASRKGRVG